MFGMQLPAFMLKQFYQVGSLENLPGAFQFALVNPLMPATIVEIMEVSAGGMTYELAEIQFSQDGEVREAAAVCVETPVDFRKGAQVTVMVKGYNLNPGSHPIKVKVRTEEFGPLKVEVEDAVRHS